MKEIRFTVEGFRLGVDEPVKRGLKLEVDASCSKETYLRSFQAALEALLLHKEQELEHNERKLNHDGLLQEVPTNEA